MKKPSVKKRGFPGRYKEEAIIQSKIMENEKSFGNIPGRN
jgi:hypothetical protein